MEPSCVRHTLIPATSQLFGDFLYHHDRVNSFFPKYFGDPDSFRAAASEINFPDVRRAQLVAALRELNGDSPALHRLATSGTVAVVTGQQVGLFSGPAYTVYKAITAAKLAAELTASGIPAVPVFWLATEDHDLAEVDHAWVFDQHVAPQKVALPPTANGGPVGEVAFPEWPIDALRQALGSLPFADEVVERVRQAYRPSVKLGDGFRSLLQDVLRDLGLLFLDPLSPAIRNIAAPFLSTVAAEIPRLVPLLQDRNKQLESVGYHAQVHVESDSALLFLINGKRTALKLNGNRFISKDRTYTASELGEMGASLSPNALLRPVMQDYLLPTVAYVGGPAEVAYMAQAQVLYDNLLGRMPVIFPRNSYTLLDSRANKILDKYSLKLPNLLNNHEKVREVLASQLVPTALTGQIADLRSSVGTGIAKLQADLSQFDPTLNAAANKSAAKILYQLDKLQRKTAREAIRRDQKASNDAAYVLNLVYPERHLQERFYSFLPFLAKHGSGVIGDLYDQAQIVCPDHMIRIM